METREYCYLLSISDWREKYFENFYGVFMNEASLIQAYQELENTDPRISGEKSIALVEINIYRIPYNCLFYRTNSLELNQYDFADFIRFQYRISLNEVADVMRDKIIEKLGYDFRESYDRQYSFMDQLSDFEKQFLIDFNYLDSIWKPIEDARKIKNNLSGWDYSKRYASEHKKYITRETMDIRFDGEGNLECRVSNVYKEGKKQPASFQTFFGTFITNNQGEFGGELTLPNGETIFGNFCEVIECGNLVYAIDSLGHMGIGRFSLYSFYDNGKYELVYRSRTKYNIDDFSKDEKCLYDNLVYGGHYVYNDELYVVIHGYRESFEDDYYRKEYEGCSRILIISNGSVKRAIEFKENFSGIHKLIIRETIAYITMDKLFAVVDMENENYTLYTTLSESDESDLVEKKRK